MPDKMVALYSIIYISALSFQVLLAITYGSLTLGFASNVEGSAFYCRELFSAGGDDDAVLMVFILQIIPILLRAFSFLREAFRTEVFVSLCSSAIAFLAIWFVPDCGNLFFTAFVLGDVSLLGIIGCNIIAVFML